MEEYVAEFFFKRSLSCLSESSSISCPIKISLSDSLDSQNQKTNLNLSLNLSLNQKLTYQIAIVAYEKVVLIDPLTLSIIKEIEHGCTNLITAICGVVREGGMYLGLGMDNGLVRIVDGMGEEVSGYREHDKRVLGIIDNGDIFVSYSSDRLVVFDLRTESLVVSFGLDLKISTVSLLDNGKLVVGTESGVGHIYLVDDLMIGVVSAEVVSVGSGVILGVGLMSSSSSSSSSSSLSDIYWVLSEVIYCLSSSGVKKIPLGHRISNNFLVISGSYLLSRDTKSKYHLLQIQANSQLTEIYNFKNSRPLRSLLLLDKYCDRYLDKYFNNLDKHLDNNLDNNLDNPTQLNPTQLNPSPVLIFSDNGLSIYNNAEEYCSTDAGRENLLGVVTIGDMVLGLSNSAGRVFARLVSKEEVEPLRSSAVLFTDEDMTCLAADKIKQQILIGRKDGYLVIRDSFGSLISSELIVAKTPISSIAVVGSIRAIGAGSIVYLLGENEAREEIHYDDEVVSLCLSADGGLVLAGLADNTVRVHRLDGEPVLSLYGHSVPVLSIFVCLDSERVFTLGGDKLVKVWGLRHGDCRKTLNPGDPLGMIIHNNLLVISTVTGLIYYLKESLEQVKRVSSSLGKKRGILGSNKIAVYEHHLFTVRDGSLAYFSEGEDGTTPAEQRAKEENELEVESIAKEKRIFKVEAALELEEGLEEKDSRKVYQALLRMPKSDISRVVGSMGTQMREVFAEVLVEIVDKEEYNPLYLGWSIKCLFNQERLTQLLPAQAVVREHLRRQARSAMAAQSALQWLLDSS
ncbi:hypothetical protein NEHOM01_1794 [Nematocida homosporus]|uniref:uncharacterized protein n=1 Tax=Nematocida homosporus TaxID=1912981 RepID=UPI00221E9AE9|nr:uncharacterized protein NEHOM01_1794 [Nematocida homosporus]KAI5186910.1 hypothetical protein NEHOM01_1794 [Nematocida homosporus]